MAADFSRCTITQGKFN